MSRFLAVMRRFRHVAYAALLLLVAGSVPFVQASEFVFEQTSTNVAALLNGPSGAPFPAAQTDLVALAISVPSGNIPGNSTTTTVFYQVQNQSSAQAVRATDRMYLSIDQTLDANDLLVGSTTSAATIPSGASYTGSILLNLSNVKTYRKYYLIVSVDATQQNDDSNRANNIKASTTQMTIISPIVPTPTPPPTPPSCKPSATLNYEQGKPGSTFNVSGKCYPGGTSLTVTVNGAQLANGAVSTAATIVTDPEGNFALRIVTAANAPLGYYIVETSVVDVKVGDAPTYALDSLAPQRSSEAFPPDSPTAQQVSVPESVAARMFKLFTPWLMR